MKIHLRFQLIVVIVLLSTQAIAQTKVQQAPTEKITPLDPKTQIATDDEEVSAVFKDMVVVQRKAKKKAGSFLFTTYSTIEFSDGPISAYALNTNIGYALSDFLEVYANFVPAYVIVERSIVNKVRSLTLQGGGQANITYARPRMQYGLDVLWLPAYGKESWGPTSIVRSDTFLKFSGALINFEGGESGLRFAAMIGKTYFIAKYFNARIAAGTAYVQSIVDGEKKYNWAPNIEAGFVFYF